MGYSSKEGRRPFELASKASHHHIINDAKVQALLGRIQTVPRAQKANFGTILLPFKPTLPNPIQHIIATDGGYAEVEIEKAYPSRLMHFLQVGALYFRADDLAKIERSEFILPEDMARLRNIERLKLALPTRNMRLNAETSLKSSVLTIVSEFFRESTLGESVSMMDTLAWFLFRRYKGSARTPDEKEWYLATSPTTNDGITLSEKDLDPTAFTFACPKTGGQIRLTDVFRLHERIDEESGATGILGYLTNVIEHIVIIHLIRSVLSTSPTLLSSILFIKDGPCGFFGQTANLYKPMLDLVEWLQAHHNLYLVGLEKSGAFVDHAQEIRDKLSPGSVLLLDNDYIYDYIIPGQGTKDRPYGSTTNYAHKVIFKTRRGEMHVVSVPCSKLSLKPVVSELQNLDGLLTNVEQLHCDMYDSALFPVALVNKLVSLAAHPSRTILQNFAKSAVS